MIKKSTICSSLLVLAVAGAAVLAATASQRGRNDEPVIPGTNWHVHDRDRPQPRIVAPAAAFSDNAPPPADAVVLFDGKDLSKWLTPNDQPAGWQVDQSGGFVKTGRYNIHTKDRFADFQLHLEFATPAQVRGSDQSRGNSGVLINGMYEVQVLDSFNSKTYPDGQCGAPVRSDPAAGERLQRTRPVADLRHHLRVAPLGRQWQPRQEGQRDGAPKRTGAAPQAGVPWRHRRHRRPASAGRIRQADIRRR